MAKDKQAKKVSMKDLINEHKLSDPVADSTRPQTAPETEVFQYDEAYEAKLIAYNENLDNLDPDYASMTPRLKTLVRVVVKELDKTEAGLIIPNKQIVSMQTQNGIAAAGTMESPYPYSQEVIVVATSPHINDLQPGDRCILDKSPTMGIAIGRGDNAEVRIPAGFTHPRFYKGVGLPTDPEDKNYGYLLVPSTQLEIKL